MRLCTEMPGIWFKRISIAVESRTRLTGMDSSMNPLIIPYPTPAARKDRLRIVEQAGILMKARFGTRVVWTPSVICLLTTLALLVVSNLFALN